MTKTPSMDLVVNTIISRTSEFGFVYVAPEVVPSLPMDFRWTRTMDRVKWLRLTTHNLDPDGRKLVKPVRAPSCSSKHTVLLEWAAGGYRLGSVAHRLKAETEAAWWLYGPMPRPPKALRMWACDIAEMLWILAWPSSPAFAASPLGRALSTGNCKELHPHADALQDTGDPLGVALSMRALGLGNPLAVALEIHGQTARLRLRDREQKHRPSGLGFRSEDA